MRLTLLILFICFSQMVFGQLRTCDEDSDNRLTIVLESDNTYRSYKFEEIKYGKDVVKIKTNEYDIKKIELDDQDLGWYPKVDAMRKKNEKICARKSKYNTDEK